MYIGSKWSSKWPDKGAFAYAVFVNADKEPILADTACVCVKDECEIVVKGVIEALQNMPADTTKVTVHTDNFISMKLLMGETVSPKISKSVGGNFQTLSLNYKYEIAFCKENTNSACIKPYKIEAKKTFKKIKSETPRGKSEEPVSSELHKIQYNLYTDGSCDNLSEKREGGYAYVITDKADRIVRQFSEGGSGVTNNRMELKAIIEGCKAIPEDGADVTIISDSQYALNVLSGRYNSKKNLDLIEQHTANKVRLNLSYSWIKGHNGNPMNELVDRLAFAEMVKIKGHETGLPAEKIHKERDKYNVNDTPQPFSILNSSVSKFDYSVYVTTVWGRGITGNAFIILDSNNEVIEKVSFRGGISQPRESLSVIYESFKSIPEVGVNIVVYSDVVYSIFILAGIWKPKKNLDLVEKIFEYEKHSRISYRLCKFMSLPMKEACLMANKELQKQ